MAISLDEPHVGPFPRPRPWLLGRWSGLSALLVAEILGLTVRFDAQALVGHGGWWSALFEYAHYVPQALTALAVAVLLFWGPRLRDAFHRLAPELNQAHGFWPFVLGHLATFSVFVVLTAMVCEGNLHDRSWAGAWVLAWMTTGTATLVFWAAAALPASLWAPAARRGLGVLLTGLVVGIAACGAGWLTSFLWQPLGRSTLWVVHQLLRLVTREVVCQPERFVVGTSTFAVEIAPHCSGYEGIGLIWVFLGVYLWRCRRGLRFPLAFLLVPLGTVVIWAANAVRIAVLVAIGTWGSPAVALGGFHSLGGWLAFNAVGLGMIVVAQRSRFFRAEAEAPARPLAGPSPTAAYLAPWLAIMATGLLTGALTHGFDRYYPLRVLVAGFVLWHFRQAYAALRWTWSWQAVAFGAAAFAIWMALEPARASDPSGANLARGLAGLTPWWARGWILARIVGSVITVPLAEELAFRGYLTRRLVAIDFQEVLPGQFSWPSFIVSSSLFGALHGRWLAGTLAGLLFALALYRRGEIADAVLAHSTTNALIATYVIVMGTWSLWT